MATVNELEQFLSKRGYGSEVTKVGSTFVISIHSQTVDEVVKLMASIGEPGRFVVGVKLGDVVPVLGEMMGVFKLKEDVKTLDANVKTNLNNLETSLKEDDKTVKSNLEDLVLKTEKAIDERLKKIDEVLKGVSEDMSYIKSQPWWKRFLGVK